MNTKEYYLDSCIWLNLFKKEGDPAKGVPYWKLAQDFVKQAEGNGDLIFVSTIVLKELTFKLNQIRKVFEISEVIKIKPTITSIAKYYKVNNGNIQGYL